MTIQRGLLPACVLTQGVIRLVGGCVLTGFLVRELLKGGKEAYGVEAASLPLETYAKDLLDNNTVCPHSLTLCLLITLHVPTLDVCLANNTTCPHS